MKTFKPGDLALVIRIPNLKYAPLPAPQPGEIITIDSDLLQPGTVVDTYAGRLRLVEPSYTVHTMSGIKTYAWHRTLKPLPPFEDLDKVQEEEKLFL